MMIEDFGARIVSVWEGLRPATRKLVVGALQSNPNPASATPRPPAGVRDYDARADWELSRLLFALDERAAESGNGLTTEQVNELRRMAGACASVLQAQTQSAEVFSQLVDRAMKVKDYALIDRLADTLTHRFSAGEMCELVRNTNPVVRALAHEALVQLPLNSLIGTLDDPLDGEIARDAIARQAFEFGSDEARQFMAVLDQEGSDDTLMD
ncbi:MAG: hypothetical protein ABIP75_05770 [Pyrinomonadaceae bacterium]